MTANHGRIHADAARLVELQLDLLGDLEAAA